MTIRDALAMVDSNLYEKFAEDPKAEEHHIKFSGAYSRVQWAIRDVFRSDEYELPLKKHGLCWSPEISRGDKKKNYKITVSTNYWASEEESHKKHKVQELVGRVSFDIPIKIYPKTKTVITGKTASGKDAHEQHVCGIDYIAEDESILDLPIEELAKRFDEKVWEMGRHGYHAAKIIKLIGDLYSEERCDDFIHSTIGHFKFPLNEQIKIIALYEESRHGDDE